MQPYTYLSFSLRKQPAQVACNPRASPSYKPAPEFLREWTKPSGPFLELALPPSQLSLQAVVHYSAVLEICRRPG